MQITDRLHAFFWESMHANNCNTYFIDGRTPILIDPGHLEHFGHVEDGLSQIRVTEDSIGLVVCTHAHPDHIEAASRFQHLPAKIAYHKKAWETLNAMGNIGETYDINPETLVPDIFLAEGELNVGGLNFHVLHTPGHAPGAICLYWTDLKALFTGDLIFSEGIGRTDLPGGDSSLLKESVEKIKKLDVEILLPGHGAPVAGKKEIEKVFTDVEQFWIRYA